jgi:hypothetical protein
MNKKVLIATPIHNRDWILPYYLTCLYNLEYEKKLLDIYWIVNNSNDQSLFLLQDFKSQHINEYNSITIEIYNNSKIPKDERKTNVRVLVYPWLAELRNKLLKKCITLNCDYLWSSDSDILFKKDTLNRLISHSLPIVSCLLYNGYKYDGIDLAYKHSNILKETSPRQYQHIVNYRTKNPETNPIGTLLECQYTGASILISNEICKKTKYDNNETYGEDEPFCWSARQNNFKLFCDISLYVQHVMSKEFLEQFKDFN